KATDSTNGASGSYNPPTGIAYLYFITCSDSLASGSCQIENSLHTYTSFDYQVEVCGPNYDSIIPAQPSNVPVSTLIQTGLMTTIPSGITNVPPTGSSNRTPGPATDNANSPTSSGLGSGGTAAIVILTLLFVFALGVGVILWYRSRNLKARRDGAEVNQTASADQSRGFNQPHPEEIVIDTFDHGEGSSNPPPTYSQAMGKKELTIEEKPLPSTPTSN
ncbi:6624_t:CDS:1, partial [Dentiscutata heterogama]